jgi:hypothetical protein
MTMTSTIKDKIFAAVVITLIYTSAAVGIHRDAEQGQATVSAQATSEVQADTQAPRFGS